MIGISRRLCKSSSCNSVGTASSELLLGDGFDRRRQSGKGKPRSTAFSLGSQLHPLAILLHMAAVTMETGESLHSNATDKGQLISAEICQMETFRVSCSEENEVLVVHSALLGRMHLGRCITEAFGYLNCSLDVLPEMDVFCSGRRSCEVKVDDGSFNRRVPRCHRDLKNHLKVTYSCVKVVFPAGGSKCHPIELDHGFISSAVAESTGCGQTGTPWVIQADPGQRINVTVYDFFHEHGELTDPDPSSGSSSSSPSAAAAAVDIPRTCRVYASVRELPSPARNLKVCERQRRISHAYLSAGHRVEIRVIARKHSSNSAASTSIQQPLINSPQFLLKFQVVGCADLTVSKDMHIDRLGDRMTVGCHGSDRSWQLVCSENKWVGSYGNCEAEDVTSDSSLHHATSTMILVVIAVVVSSLILVVGIVCIKRKKREIDGRVRTLPVTPSGDQQYNLASYSIGTMSPTDKLTPSAAAAAAQSRNFSSTPSYDGTGNEYARMRIMCLPQYDVNDPPPYDDDAAAIEGRYGMPAAMEHIYESPDSLCGGRRSPSAEGRRVPYTTRSRQQPPPSPPVRQGGVIGGGGGTRAEESSIAAAGSGPRQATTNMTQDRKNSCSQKHGCSNRSTGNYSL